MAAKKVMSQIFDSVFKKRIKIQLFIIAHSARDKEAPRWFPETSQEHVVHVSTCVKKSVFRIRAVFLNTTFRVKQNDTFC